jgi:hypothetical protein
MSSVSQYQSKSFSQIDSFPNYPMIIPNTIGPEIKLAAKCIGNKQMAW